MEFSHKWVKQAGCKLFGKDDIDESDIARIKYLAIGESFQNDFFIEMSLEQPPKPFVNTDGGDEWILCLRGGEIAKLAEDYKDKSNAILSMYYLDYEEDDDWQEYCCSTKVRTTWEKFTEGIVMESYYEEHDDEEFDDWYDGVRGSLWRDIVLFTGVEVLRIQGTQIPDLTVLDKFPDLRVLELVETLFVSTDGIENLNKLEQLSCWRD